VRFEECTNRIQRHERPGHASGTAVGGGESRRLEINHADEVAARIDGDGAGETRRWRGLNVRSFDLSWQAAYRTFSVLYERIVNADKT